jgi:hypothetical protein
VNGPTRDARTTIVARGARSPRATIDARGTRGTHGTRGRPRFRAALRPPVVGAYACGSSSKAHELMQ